MEVLAFLHVFPESAQRLQLADQFVDLNLEILFLVLQALLILLHFSEQAIAAFFLLHVVLLEDAERVFPVLEALLGSCLVVLHFVKLGNEFLKFSLGLALTGLPSFHAGAELCLALLKLLAHSVLLLA